MRGVRERTGNSWRLEITGEEDGRRCYGKAGKNKQERQKKTACYTLLR
jgi:hypothetical protein